MAGGVRLIRPHERPQGAPTPGMTREEAVATDRQWAGVARTEAGMNSGWHHHGDFESTIYVLSGAMTFEVGARDQPREGLTFKAGDAFRITPFTVHRMIAIEDCDILEVSTPDLDDVVRLEDRYGRKGTSEA